MLTLCVCVCVGSLRFCSGFLPLPENMLVLFIINDFKIDFSLSSIPASRSASCSTKHAQVSRWASKLEKKKTFKVENRSIPLHILSSTFLFCGTLWDFSVFCFFSLFFSFSFLRDVKYVGKHRDWPPVCHMVNLVQLLDLIHASSDRNPEGENIQTLHRKASLRMQVWTQNILAKRQQY